MGHLKFTIFKCAEFSSFGDTTFLWEWNSISNFKIGENFTNDFPVKKNYRGFLCKMSSDQNYRQFFCKIFCWWSPMWNNFFMGTKFNFKYLWWATSRSPDRPPVKRFSDYVETWPTSSSWYTNVRYFWVLVKKLFYGSEIQFQVSKFRKILQRIYL